MDSLDQFVIVRLCAKKVTYKCAKQNTNHLNELRCYDNL